MYNVQFLNSNVSHLNLSELLLYTNSTITAAGGFSMYYIDITCKTAPPDAKNSSGNDSVVHFDAFSASRLAGWWGEGQECLSNDV